MANYAVMPVADYEDACNAVREKTGNTEVIKSGDMGAQIRAIKSGASVDTCTVFIDTYTARCAAAVYSGEAFTGYWSADVNFYEPGNIENVVCGSILYIRASLPLTSDTAELLEKMYDGDMYYFHFFRIPASAAGSIISVVSAQPDF